MYWKIYIYRLFSDDQYYTYTYHLISKIPQSLKCILTFQILLGIKLFHIANDMQDTISWK